MQDTDQTNTAQGAPPFPPITLTEEDWLAFFDEVEATDAEKIELIRTLWAMMKTFTDISWHCPPVKETSGQVPELADALRRAVLDSETGKEDV